MTEDVTVVEGEMATISCRVKNSDDSVIQLLNPNRQTIYFRDFRREFKASGQPFDLNVWGKDLGGPGCFFPPDEPSRAVGTLVLLLGLID